MGFYPTNLDHFDSMKAVVSWTPFSEAREIIWRARYLLQGRTSKQVRWLADEIDSCIEVYFDIEKQQAISAIESDGKHDLLETDEDGNFREFKSEAFENYAINTPDNTRPIDAAKEALEGIERSEDPDIPNVKDYEYFAAMALTMVGGYLESLESTFDFKQMKRIPRKNKNYEPHEVSIFGSNLIEAMEVVTYAECLKEILQLKELTEATIGRAEKLAKEGVKKGIEEIKKAETEKRRAWGQIGKEKSLQRRNQSRDAVLATYDKNPAYQSKSIAAAAAELWVWLSQEARRQDLDTFAVGTINEWISAHRKAKSNA